jgi:hypothetical protein
MVSNLGMVLRNIYSKKSLVDFKVGPCQAGAAGWQARSICPSAHRASMPPC